MVAVDGSSLQRFTIQVDRLVTRSDGQQSLSIVQHSEDEQDELLQ